MRLVCELSYYFLNIDKHNWKEYRRCSTKCYFEMTNQNNLEEIDSWGRTASQQREEKQRFRQEMIFEHGSGKITYDLKKIRN